MTALDGDNSNQCRQCGGLAGYCEQFASCPKRNSAEVSDPAHSHADPMICRERGCNVAYDPRPSGPVSDDRLLQEVWDRGLMFKVKVQAAIPEPLYVGWRLKKSRCDCGEVFRERVQYRGHYALVHILGRV